PSWQTRLTAGFEENRGQADRRVLFTSRHGARTLFLTDREAVVAGGADVFRLRPFFRRKAKPIGEGPLPGALSFYVGNRPDRWRTGVSRFARVRYPRVADGVDLVFHQEGG